MPADPGVDDRRPGRLDLLRERDDFFPALPVLDEVELARQHGDLTGTFETTATKLETLLADKFGLERFGEAGEAFDPQLHEALMAVDSTEVTEPSVAMVLQPGYRLGEKVVRAARVQVANPA